MKSDMQYNAIQQQIYQSSNSQQEVKASHSNQQILKQLQIHIQQMVKQAVLKHQSEYHRKQKYSYYQQTMVDDGNNLKDMTHKQYCTYLASKLTIDSNLTDIQKQLVFGLRFAIQQINQIKEGVRPQQKNEQSSIKQNQKTKRSRRTRDQIQYKYSCFIKNCQCSYSAISSLKTHLHRDHKICKDSIEVTKISYKNHQNENGVKEKPYSYQFKDKETHHRELCQCDKYLKQCGYKKHIMKFQQQGQPQQ